MTTVKIWLRGPPRSGKTYFRNNILIPYLGNNTSLVTIYDGDWSVPDADVIITFNYSITNIFYESHGIRPDTAIYKHILDYMNVNSYPFAVFHPKKRSIYAGELSSIDHLFEQAALPAYN